MSKTSFNMDMLVQMKKAGIFLKIKSCYATPSGMVAEVICQEPNGDYGVYKIELEKTQSLEVDNGKMC